MDILNEIKEAFASKLLGQRNIKSLSEEYPAVTIIQNDGYGVAIQTSNEEDYNESFSSCMLFTQLVGNEEVQIKYLILWCKNSELRNEFATFCTQFVEPGEEGKERELRIKNPLEWWTRWKQLFGNVVSELTTYDVIGEMLALESVFDEEMKTEWTGASKNSHDIESVRKSVEVKSTIKKYESTVTIAGQHQLKSEKRLLLYFCRLEKSIEGISIDELSNRLIKKGYNKKDLEDKLSGLGFGKGASVRKEKYKVLEKRKYEVNEAFPKITDDSFKENKLPQSIVKISYTVDLNGMEYTLW